MTPAQLSALATDIAANTATALGTTGQIKDLAHSEDNAFAVAAWYSLAAVPDYFVWGKDIPASLIFDAVMWANYTPADAADSTVLYQNRAMLIQTKQMNLQLLLQGRAVFDASKKNLRSGLNDATTNLPSGVLGASRSGGWATILPFLSRKANSIEKLFAIDDGAGIGNTTTDPRGASTNPDAAVIEGNLTTNDVKEAWGI
jgi:hypothetical protein